MTTAEYWAGFLRETGRDMDTQYFECFYFGMGEELANDLLRLVLTGQKRATTSSLWAFEKEGSRPPEVGDYSIVTDWDGHPRCVIRTSAVTVLLFRDVTFDICGREGEDDDLESWRRGHARVFAEEGKEMGYAFSEDMPVVFEDFEVVYAK